MIFWLVVIEEQGNLRVGTVAPPSYKIFMAAGAPTGG